MTISKLAAHAGVNIETVRFYERRGLLKAPPRPTSGYRQYGADDLRRIRFIRRARELGFTLEEAGQLVRLNDDPVHGRAEALSRVESHLADVDARLRDLQRMRDALAHLAAACREGHDAHCPILAALDTDETEPRS